MIRRSLRSIATTWLAGLLVLLPLALTLGVLAYAFDLAYRLVGPGSLVGRFFAALGYPFTSHSGLAYLLGTLVLVGAVYVLGLLLRAGLEGPFRRLTDRTLRRIPILGGVYNVADRFVGLLDQRPGVDIGAMSPVWCFFGGHGGAAVLALAPSADPSRSTGTATSRCWCPARRCPSAAPSSTSPPSACDRPTSTVCCLPATLCRA
jgi:uncharacterized membrane protein